MINHEPGTDNMFWQLASTAPHTGAKQAASLIPGCVFVLVELDGQSRQRLALECNGTVCA